MDILKQIKDANRARCPEFGQGHLLNWSVERWALCVAGEAGELCNMVKKQILGKDIPDEEIGKEIADIVLYCDLLAQRMGFDLGRLLIAKFNEVSDRIDSSVRIPEPSSDILMPYADKLKGEIRSLMKLDKNFHVYVHGDKNLLEPAADENGKFLKLYYKEIA